MGVEPRLDRALHVLGQRVAGEGDQPQRRRSRGRRGSRARPRSRPSPAARCRTARGPAAGSRALTTPSRPSAATATSCPASSSASRRLDGRVAVVLDDEHPPWGHGRGRRGGGAHAGRRGRAAARPRTPRRARRRRCARRPGRRAARRGPSRGRDRGRGRPGCGRGRCRPARTARTAAPASRAACRCPCRTPAPSPGRPPRPPRCASARPRRELGRVLEEVADHLGEARGVGEHEERLAALLDFHRDLAGPEHRAVVLERAAHDRAQLEPLALELDLVPRDPRDVEEVVDERRELRDLPLDDRAGLPGLLGVRRHGRARRGCS